MTAKDLGDAAAVTGAIGSYASWLPEVAALFAIIWTAIRIYEWARVRVFNLPPDRGFE